MKNYLKYFGVFYVVIILGLIVLGWFYVQELPVYTKEKITPMTAPVKDTTKDSTQVTGDLPMIKGVLSPPVDVFKLYVSTPEQIEKGKGLFTMNCVSCHGNEGKGDGVAGLSLNPKPRNFTSLEGWTNGPKFIQMYKTLQEGILNKGMASYANLPPEDRIAMIHYIQQTFTKNFPQSSVDELKELDKVYSLMQGVKMPNQIPIKMAIEKVLNDNKTQTAKITALTSVIEKNTDSAAVIFRGIAKNITHALTSLTYDTSWMSNDKALSDLMAKNLGNNGFRINAYALTPRELTMVHAYLRNLFMNFKNS